MYILLAPIESTGPGMYLLDSLKALTSRGIDNLSCVRILEPWRQENIAKISWDCKQEVQTAGTSELRHKSFQTKKTMQIVEDATGLCLVSIDYKQGLTRSLTEWITQI